MSAKQPQTKIGSATSAQHTTKQNNLPPSPPPSTNVILLLQTCLSSRCTSTSFLCICAAPAHGTSSGSCKTRTTLSPAAAAARFTPAQTPAICFCCLLLLLLLRVACRDLPKMEGQFIACKANKQHKHHSKHTHTKLLLSWLWLKLLQLLHSGSILKVKHLNVLVWPSLLIIWKKINKEQMNCG